MSVELRAIIPSLALVNDRLIEQGAVYKGDYAFTDIFYHPSDSFYDFNTEFVRLRIYTTSQWAHKPVVLTHKRKTEHDARALTIRQLEFDTKEAAAAHLSGYRQAFTACRNGFEYALHSNRIFTEDIEYLPPTIEVIASTQQEALDIVDYLGDTELLHDNVPALIAKALKLHSINTYLDRNVRGRW